MLCSTSMVFASDLNGVGSNTTTTPQATDKGEYESTAEAVGDMFGNAGINEESIAEAQEFLKPVAVIMNKIMATILGLASLGMMLITVLDLFYITFPPIRDLLDGGTTGGQPLKRSRSLGMEGDIEGPGMKPEQQAGGGLSALGRWVSDEALASSMEAQRTGKMVVAGYFKKRSIFLVLFGICVVLFTSTVFTDLGVNLGMWVLSKVNGFL